MFRPDDPDDPGAAREPEPGPQSDSESFRDTVRRPRVDDPVVPAPARPATARRRRRWLPVVAGLSAAAVLAVGAAVAFNQPAWLTGSSAQSSAPVPTPVAIVPQSATADCQAPPATDDAGRPVSYATKNVLDGDPATAWRCDGTGLGRTIVFIFAPGQTIHQASLVNGYAKTDESSGTHRYPEYRRLTAVSWLLPDGSILRQELVDGVETPQTIELPPFAGTVTLRIETSSAPGSNAANRDAVLISDVAFS